MKFRDIVNRYTTSSRLLGINHYRGGKWSEWVLSVHRNDKGPFYQLTTVRSSTHNSCSALCTVLSIPKFKWVYKTRVKLKSIKFHSTRSLVHVHRSYGSSESFDIKRKSMKPVVMKILLNAKSTCVLCSKNWLIHLFHRIKQKRTHWFYARICMGWVRDKNEIEVSITVDLWNWNQQESHLSKQSVISRMQKILFSRDFFSGVRWLYWR